MPGKMLILENGVGMVLDPGHFLHSNAMEDEWNDPFRGEPRLYLGNPVEPILKILR